MSALSSPPRRAARSGAAVTAAMAALFVSITVLAVGLAADLAVAGFFDLGRVGLIVGGLVAAGISLAAAVVTARCAFAAERRMTGDPEQTA